MKLSLVVGCTTASTAGTTRCVCGSTMHLTSEFKYRNETEPSIMMHYGFNGWDHVVCVWLGTNQNE